MNLKQVNPEWCLESQNTIFIVLITFLSTCPPILFICSNLNMYIEIKRIGIGNIENTNM